MKCNISTASSRKYSVQGRRGEKIVQNLLGNDLNTVTHRHSYYNIIGKTP